MPSVAPNPNRHVYFALTLVATLIGFALRVELARTFAPFRGHDYRVYLEGIQWVVDHHGHPFDASTDIQVGYQPPLWYLLGAAAQRLGATPHRAGLIASLAVLGWVIRHAILARFLWRIAPGFSASSTIVLALHAVIPLGVLMDGQVNPEGLHATLFTVALYVLWGAEQHARRLRDVSLVRAALFGLIAGVALLVKATGASLVLVAAATLGQGFARRASADGSRAAMRGVGLPALLAAAVWAGTVSWWCVPNYRHYGHPFPHIYQVKAEETVTAHPILRSHLLDRRSLGWALPFDLDYLYRPVAVSPTSPRPNFWTVQVAGTWADYTHRGFCRNGTSPAVEIVWYGPVYHTSARCLALGITLVRIGIWVSLAAVACVALELSRGLRWRRGDATLAVPLSVLSVVGFTMAFALTYPLDMFEVVKPNYLVAIVTPMSMCLGLALSRREVTARGVTWLHVALGVAVALVAGLVLAERVQRPNESDGPHHGYIPG